MPAARCEAVLNSDLASSISSAARLGKHVTTKLEKEPISSRGTRLPRDQRRVQLLDAANEVFRSKGYHAAAMDDIADAAGVSKPVLYQHFPSKLDLYLALLDQSCDRLVEIVEEALDSTEDNADRVVATVAAFFEFVSSDSGEFRLCLRIRSDR